MNLNDLYACNLVVNMFFLDATADDTRNQLRDEEVLECPVSC